MNALIDQLRDLRLHGMASCAQDLLAARTPPSLSKALSQLVEAETTERQGVRSLIRCDWPSSLIIKIWPALIMALLI